MIDETDETQDHDGFMDEGEAAGYGGVGATLADARREAGLDLAQVSAETRIPERHLSAIERGDFGALPARTYAVGFSRTYAKMLGLDDREIADRVRAEMGVSEADHADRPAKFEPGDPARVPSRGLAWFGIVAAIVLLAGIYAFYSAYFSPGMGPAPLEEEQAPLAAAETQEAAVPANAIDPAGEVVFTALEDGIWARFYDGEGERLYEAQMSRNETFVVPADAKNPQIWTGRPNAFAITIDGKSVAKLAEDDFVMRDQPISAEALLARQETTQTPAAPVATDGAT